MPIYEYACGKCGHEFEVEQRITEDPIKTCPACRSRKVKKLISQTSFVLKGGGWYSDLYSSGGKKDAKKDGEASPGTSADKSEKPDKKDKPDTSEKKQASGGDKGDAPKRSGGDKGGKKAAA